MSSSSESDLVGKGLTSSYAEFVTISKEISTLENDMVELKELLSQWKDLPQLMGMEDTLAPRLDKEGNRKFFNPASANAQSSVGEHSGTR
jgi:hypothetical protein